MSTKDLSDDELKKFKESIVQIIVREPILDKIRAEVEGLPKVYPFVNHCYVYVKEDAVKKIIDKYKQKVRKYK